MNIIVKVTFFLSFQQCIAMDDTEYPLASEHLILFVYEYCFFRTIFSEIMWVWSTAVTLPPEFISFKREWGEEKNFLLQQKFLLLFLCQMKLIMFIESGKQAELENFGVQNRVELMVLNLVVTKIIGRIKKLQRR